LKRSFPDCFTDAFKNRIDPTLIIRRADVPERLNTGEVAASFDKPAGEAPAARVDGLPRSPQEQGGRGQKSRAIGPKTPVDSNVFSAAQLENLFLNGSWLETDQAAGQFNLRKSDSTNGRWFDVKTLDPAFRVPSVEIFIKKFERGLFAPGAFGKRRGKASSRW